MLLGNPQPRSALRSHTQSLSGRWAKGARRKGHADDPLTRSPSSGSSSAQRGRQAGGRSVPSGAGCWAEFTEPGTPVGAPACTSSVNLEGARGRRGGFGGFRGQRPSRPALLGDRLPGDARRQARLLRPHGAETAQRRRGRAHEPRGPGRDLVTPGSGNPVGWAAPPEVCAPGGRRVPARPLKVWTSGHEERALEAVGGHGERGQCQGPQACETAFLLPTHHEGVEDFCIWLYNHLTVGFVESQRACSVFMT